MSKVLSSTKFRHLYFCKLFEKGLIYNSDLYGMSYAKTAQTSENGSFCRVFLSQVPVHLPIACSLLEN